MFEIHLGKWRPIRGILLLAVVTVMAGLVGLQQRLVVPAEAALHSAVTVPELLFTDSPTSGTSGIFRTDIDNRIAEHLTNSNPTFGVSWSPDGSKIAFSGSISDVRGVYVMDADGGNVTFLKGNASYPSWSPDGTKIVFHDESATPEIWVMNGDGSGVVPLTTNSAKDMTPAWSPDGETIAFVSDRDSGDGGEDIYLMDKDGSNPTRLAELQGNDRFPDWSPDGTKLLFSSDRTDEPTIYMIGADGNNLTTLTTDDDDIYDYFPSWSPDGTKILFTRTVSGYFGLLYVMDANGSNETQLTWHGQDDYYPEWSPDGKQIVFARGGAIFVMNADGEDIHFVSEGGQPAPNLLGDRIAYSGNLENGHSEIVVMDLDGSNQIPLTNNNVDDTHPTWSPDGSKIAFERFDAVGQEWKDFIYTMNSNGTDQRPITATGADRFPDWSPYGEKIVFMSYRDGNEEIYVMDADGGNQKRLTNHDAYDYFPDWSPDGQKIVFISSREGGNGIYVMDANGANVKRLSPPGEFARSPAWSTDGTLIAYQAHGIFVMNADGSQPRQITEGGADPAWLPATPATGTITVRKEVAWGSPSAEWQFSGDLGDFTLPPLGGSETFESLIPGTYIVQETTVAGYTARVGCTSGSHGAAWVLIEVGAGEDIVCTFINTFSQAAHKVFLPFNLR